MDAGAGKGLMFREFKETVLRSDLVMVVSGLAIALALFFLAQTVVANLIGPLIAVFVGSSNLSLEQFAIRSSEFRYGAVIEAALVLVLVLVVAYLLAIFPFGRRVHGKVAARMRACPECTSSISVAAKRCPHCTAVVQP